MLASLELFWRLPLTMVAVWNYDGYLQLANPVCREMLGWPHDALESVPYWELIHPDEQQVAVTAVEGLMDQAGSRFGDEVRVLCRDGRYRWTRWHTCAAPASRLLCSVGLDVSDIRPDDGCDRIQVGTWDWQLRTSTITLSGDLFGLPDDSSVRYQTFLQNVYFPDRELLDQSLHRSMTSGQVLNEDVRVVAPDSRVVPVHVAGRLASRPGDPEQRMSGIVRQSIGVTDHAQQAQG
jgi:PAS domain S-box-containing protein